MDKATANKMNEAQKIIITPDKLGFATAHELVKMGYRKTDFAALPYAIINGKKCFRWVDVPSIEEATAHREAEKRKKRYNKIFSL